MISQFIPRSLAVRNAAHLAHWSTRSDAQHRALQAFYEGLLDSLDEYVECYQGNFGLVQVDGQVEASSTDILHTLKTEAVWLEDNRDGIANGVKALDALLDDLVNLYLKTIYKLENLS